MATFDITDPGDLFDSREVTERFEELTSVTTPEDWRRLDDDERPELDEDEIEEVNALIAFIEEAEGECDDFWHGETFISAEYFEDYMKDLVKDCGYFDSKDVDFDRWPYNCIDWEQVADQAKVDYSEVEIEGTTYYFR